MTNTEYTEQLDGRLIVKVYFLKTLDCVCLCQDRTDICLLQNSKQKSASTELGTHIRNMRTAENPDNNLHFGKNSCGGGGDEQT